MEPVNFVAQTFQHGIQAVSFVIERNDMEDVFRICVPACVQRFYQVVTGTHHGGADTDDLPVCTAGLARFLQGIVGQAHYFYAILIK